MLCHRGATSNYSALFRCLEVLVCLADRLPYDFQFGIQHLRSFLWVFSDANAHGHGVFTWRSVSPHGRYCRFLSQTVDSTRIRRRWSSAVSPSRTALPTTPSARSAEYPCGARQQTDTPHTRLFLDMFDLVHTSHCGSRCRSVCLTKSLTHMSSHV